MTRRRLAILLFFIIVPLSGSYDTTASQVSAGLPAGEYRGGYGSPPHFTYMRLHLPDSSGRGGSVDMPFEEGTVEEKLQHVRAEGDGLRFSVGEGEKELAFELRASGLTYRGEVRHADGRAEPASFVRRVVLKPEIMAALAGTYELAPGHALGIVLINGDSPFLWYQEYPSGRCGILWSLSDTTFVAGAGFQMIEPVHFVINVLRNGAGIVGGIRWREDGGADRFAPKRTPYREEEVSFNNGDVRLAGTLLIPPTPGPHPAVVLVHGSGPQTRDGYFGNDRFMADAYARKGIAALIYDKRGTGRSTGDWNNADFAALADDAAAGVALLRARPDIDPKRIGLSGVSQAGWIMALATARIPDLRFVVMQSAGGAGVTTEVQEMRRIEMQMEADGYSARDVELALRLQHMGDEYAKTGAGWDELSAYYRSVETAPWIKYFGHPFKSKDHPDWAWFRKSVTYDPVPLWERYKGSVMAIFGTLDTETPVREAAANLEGALKRGRNRDYTIRIYPGVTHLFYAARNASEHEFPELKGLMPGYYEMITAWVIKQVGIPQRKR